MQTDEPVRPLRTGSDLSDRKRRGIAGEYRLLMTLIIKRLEQLYFQLQIFCNRFDNDLALSYPGKFCSVQVCQCLLLLVRCYLFLFNRLA